MSDARARGPLRFRVETRGGILREQDLAMYMASANLCFTAVVDDDAALRANLAHVGRFTFAHVQVPASTVLWPRTEDSQNRVVVISADTAGMSIESAVPVIAHGERWFVIPPGVTPVTFHVPSDVELVFVSLDERDLQGGQWTPARQGGSPHPSSLRPLVSFIKSFCAVTTDSTDNLGDPLERSAREIALSLLATIAGGPDGRPDVFTACMQIMVRDFASTTFSLPDLALKVGVSASSISIAMRSHGTTFSKELRSLRVKAATELRNRNPGLSYAAIAKLTGFGTRQALHRAMTRVPAMAPESRPFPLGDDPRSDRPLRGAKNLRIATR